MVRKGTHRTSTLQFAIKVVRRDNLSYDDEAALLDEISILKELENEHIIRLYDVFTERDSYYMVDLRLFHLPEKILLHLVTADPNNANLLFNAPLFIASSASGHGAT